MSEFSEHDIELLNEIFSSDVREQLRKVGRFAVQARMDGVDVSYDDDDGSLNFEASVPVIMEYFDKATERGLNPDWFDGDPRMAGSGASPDKEYSFFIWPTPTP